MHFELLRAEMRAANRQVELKFRALEEAISRTISETVRASEARMAETIRASEARVLAAVSEMFAERD
jgi:hypothetical protein